MTVLKRLVLPFVAMSLLLQPIAAQFPDGVKDDDFRRAIQFYTEGGWFCLRLAPVDGADKEREWTVVVLSSSALKATSFRLGGIEVGTGSSLNPIGAGLNIQIVMNHPDNRAEFLKRFAEGIDKGLLRARVVRTAPLEPNARVQLSNVVDLKGPELLTLRNLEQAR
ncbi:MAG TPA: hypothetical protein VMR52_00010 [Dehalococcoidia bacterium]|nr:hypothetical protein [Dehalococcoidia bacterium]